MQPLAYLEITIPPLPISHEVRDLSEVFRLFIRFVLGVFGPIPVPSLSPEILDRMAGRAIQAYSDNKPEDQSS